MAMSEGVSVLNLLAGLVLGLLAGGWITALRMRQRLAAVSYTHLTLPASDLV